MERSKRDLASDPTISNQQALVKKSLPNNKRRLIKMIPGGAQMMDPEKGTIHTDKQLANAIYTWLRHVRHFRDVKISFAKQNSEIATSTLTVEDFDAPLNGRPIWEAQPAGKRFLAEKVATAVFANKGVVSATITAKGISLEVAEDFGPAHEDWEPHLDFMPNYTAKGDYAVLR